LIDTLSAAFRDNNMKLTPQRIAIYEMLMSTKSHPSAETIYDSIKDRYPTMSLATVYKTLKALVQLNLAQEINVGEGNFRYDANAEPHPHIVCINCGRVDDIDNLDLSFINESAENFTDYDILKSKVYFYGICSDCKQNIKPTI
jgi:Fur family peroxide stress response transcriptional regulator